MAGVVIYGSQYGTTKQYAEELARRTGFEVRSYDAVVDINGYEAIVFIGALYASGVLGMKKTFDKLADFQGKKIAIATVGVADPTDAEYITTVEDGMKQQLPAGVFDAASLFHLRGGIDYSRLSFKHKALLGLMYKRAKNLPDEELTADMRAMVETYNQRVSFVDFASLDQIVAAL